VARPTTGICGDSAAPHHLVNQCGEIAAPGCYTLGADLLSSQGGPACLSLHDTANVELDCAGHAIAPASAITVDNLANFRIHGCKITNMQLFVVNIFRSSDGLIDNNDIRGGIHSSDSNRLTLSSNTVGNMYFQTYGTQMTIQDNTFVVPPTVAIASPIYLRYGSFTQVLRNRVDGSWDGRPQAGADDGIVLEDEHDDRIDGNTFLNVFDCGLETVGLLSNSIISNNVIKNAGICGIGGWYWNSWRGNRVTANTVDTSLQLFKFNRLGGLRPAAFDAEKKMPADAGVEFHDNAFENNVFTSPKSNLPSSSIPLYQNMLYNRSTQSLPPVPGTRDPRPEEFRLQNNSFTGNQFGTVTQAPSFGSNSVPGAVIDGGGNVCGALPNNPYPLDCRGGR
jgi:copper-binding protein NosD